jgi:hypothetical protein
MHGLDSSVSGERHVTLLGKWFDKVREISGLADNLLVFQELVRLMD